MRVTRLTRSAALVLTALAGTVVTLVFAVATAAPASAHATLLFTNPALGGATPAGPPSLTLVFDEPVTVPGRAVSVMGGPGAVPQVGPVRLSSAGRVLTVGLTSRLGPGAYRVRWQVLAGDGDVVGGSYSFLVGPATALGAPSPNGSELRSPTLAGSAVLRFLLFAALSLALGGEVGAALSRRVTPDRAEPPTPPTTVASAVGLTAVLGLAVLITGNGSISRGFTEPAWSSLTEAWPGRLVLVELVAFAAAVALSTSGRRRWVVGPLLGVVVAEALRAHPGVAAPGWGAVLTATHLTAAAIWVGALAQTVRTAVAWRASLSSVRAALAVYARLAAWLFAVVLVTGTASSVLLVPLGGWTSTAYGRTLLVKIALVALATGLAIVGRWRLHRPRDAGAAADPMGTASPVVRRIPAGRAIRDERLVLGAVLGVTGLLVSLPTPRALGSAAELLPPPSGIALPVGGRAGQVGVSATASAGQLVIRLTAPSLGNLADDVDRNHYDVSAAKLRSVGQPVPGGPRRLHLQPCGVGCFVAPVTWGSGLNLVTLRVGSTGWTGGSLTLRVPWPVLPGDQRLRAVVAAMRGVRTFTLYEQVSSDLSVGTGRPAGLPMSGTKFLASEPWGSGVATQSVLVEDRPGWTSTLAVGFPADRVQAELLIGPDGRIQRETLTAPGHFITRTFVYPARAGT